MSLSNSFFIHLEIPFLTLHLRETQAHAHKDTDTRIVTAVLLQRPQTSHSDNGETVVKSYNGILT